MNITKGITETVQNIGQEWQKCPFEWGLEDYLTVFTEDAGRIILVNIEQYHTESAGGVRYAPVLKGDMRVHQGSKVDL